MDGALVQPAPGNDRSAVAVNPRALQSRPRPRRYSRFVSIMKFALPVVALALAGLVILWPQLRGIEEGLPLGFGRLKLSDTGDPNMVNARFVGADSKNQPFSVTADLAKNVLSGSSKVELEMPKADLLVEDGTWLVLTANSGTYDKASKTLDLQGAVNLFHDSGYEFKTKAAKINLNQGVAVGDRPVVGQGPFGMLQAEGFRIKDRGKTMLFTGKSKLTIFPNSREAIGR